MQKFLLDNKTYILRSSVVGLILFSNAVFTVYVFPYLYLMVQNYGLASDSSEVGFYGGMLGGSAFFGRAFLCIHWGRLADTKGRIPTLLIAFVLLTILTVMFNYSTSFFSGLILRVLCGAAVGGVLVVGRVMMTEVVPTELKAMSIGITNSFWMIGTPMGMFLGGHYVNYLPSSPYMMISVILVVLAVINVLAAKYILVETLHKVHAPTTQSETQETTQNRLQNIDDPLLDANHKGKQFEMQELGQKGTEEALELQKSDLEAEKRLIKVREENFDANTEVQTYEKFYHNPNILRGVFTFSLMMFFESVLTDTLPLWLCAPYSKGGLEQDASEIGNMMGIFGIPQFFLQVLVYPMLVNSFGDSTILKFSSLCFIPTFLLVPLSHDLFALENSFIMKCYLMIVWLLGLILINLTLSALQRILNDSVQTKQRGEMNGALTTSNSLFQMLGPVLGGAMIQWSINSGLIFPFNHYCLFAFCSVVCALNYYFCTSKIIVKKEIRI